MTDIEISLLKNEIARQNRIIEALLLHNEQLRVEIAALRSGNSPENSSYSVSETEKGITTESNAVTEIGNGINKHSYSVTEKAKGINTDSYSVSEKGMGITTGRNAVPEKGNGITTVGSPVPEKVEPTTGNILRINAKFRDMKGGKVKRSGSRNSAKLLIHFHNGNGGSYTELKKVTGLSEGGVGKLIMSLKKRGLIVSSGWQRFALTAAGRQLLAG